jgi:hypothetical protein
VSDRINRKEELSEVAADMKSLYEKMVKKLIPREFGDSLANVAGKRLKAVQLDLADDIFVNEGKQRVAHVEPAKLAAAK